MTINRLPLLAGSLLATSAFAITLDFETDDFGIPLVNGQVISTVPDVQDNKGNPDSLFEFGNFVSIRSTTEGSDGHEGIAVFDSDPFGPNQFSQDPDLLVGLGNILVIQNDDSPATTDTGPGANGLVFDTPNDEKDHNDRGSIVFDFLQPSQLISIDLVDFNGNAGGTLVLTDAGNLQRVYSVPSKWTTDPTVSPFGWQTLDLTTLLPQPSEANAIGGPATAFEDPGFDPANVIRLSVGFDGRLASGGLDNLSLVPEPASYGLAMLSVVAALAVLRRRRR